jgi:hypothetical protein
MALPPAEPKPRLSATYYRPGEGVIDPEPGDFLVTHGTAWTSNLIRFGERIRYRGANRPFAYWSHAVAVVSESGEIVEALGRGVQSGRISKYRDADYSYVKIEASAEDRAEMSKFARDQVGNKYGYATIVSIALGLLTSGQLTFGLTGTEICSGVVARMLERGTYSWVDPPSVMPADLARFFDVPGPS